MEDTAALSGDAKQYVTFTNGDRHFGVEITRVREIRQWSPTTELPNQPRHTRGVLNIRGVIVPVHDLRARFGGALTDATDHHVVLILALGEKHTGVLVDAVSDIVSVTADDIRAVPEGAREMDHGAMIGLVSKDEKMIALIDAEQLFSNGEELAA